MSAWKSALVLSALSLSIVLASPFHPQTAGLAKSASAARTASAAIPITKADVYGFWSFSVDVGLDIHLVMETFFAADGTYEGRAFVDNEGEIQRIHEFGTWTLVKDTIRTFTNLNRCKTEGENVDACNDAAEDPITIGMNNGVKTLVGRDGGEFGNYIGSVKQFKNPDLFKPSALSARSGDSRSNGERGLHVRLQGNGSGFQNGPGRGFDMTGRRSGARGSAGVSVPGVTAKGHTAAPH
jgi:hypothetical protein